MASPDDAVPTPKRQSSDCVSSDLTHNQLAASTSEELDTPPHAGECGDQGGGLTGASSADQGEAIGLISPKRARDGSCGL